MCVVHSDLAVSYLCCYAEGQNPELKKKSLNSLTGVYTTLLIHIPGHESSLSAFFVYMKTIIYCYFVFLWAWCHIYLRGPYTCTCKHDWPAYSEDKEPVFK